MRHFPKTAPFAAGVLLLLLTGCGGAGGPQEPFEDDGVEGQPDDPIQADDCLLGDWLLDVDQYSASSEEYVLGLNVPIQDFAMTGDGIMTFSEDGAMQVRVDLVTSGTIVAGDANVPISVPSHYAGAGTWSRPEANVDAIDVADWESDAESAPGDSEVPVPLPDFSADPHVFVQCTDDQLVTQGADAPFGAFWTRLG